MCILHDRFALISEPTMELPPSSAALTLICCEKTILRAAWEGGVAHVLVCITRQEERRRGGSIMQYEA